MGIPLCLALLGPASLAPAIITTLLTACVLFGVAIALIEFDQHRDRHWSATLLKVARALLRNPLLAAPCWAGLCGRRHHAASRAGQLCGAAGRLGQPLRAGDHRPVPGAIAARRRPRHGGAHGGRQAAAAPAVTAVLAFAVFDMPPLWAWCAVLMAALPIGTGPFMLAQLYGRDARPSSRAILLSTVLSVPTITALVAWIGRQPPG